ncbi:MAG: raffinose/stachyose/melibiose transport system permease protein [Thermomicrobiales bacterium]|nr:raffinose/stachyose/melibiose transport system permease protein [Thermomicrobiales bacterium]
MLLVCAFVLIPIVMVFLGSFKTVDQFFAKPYGLPESFGLFNYRKAWDEANIQTALRNSVLATVVGVLVSTTLACLAAYGLGRFRFAGRLGLRLLFIGGLVVPVQLIILPLFITFRQLHLLGGLWSLIFVYSVFGIPLGVLVLTGFFGVLPKDLEDAARIDGASHFQIFWRIMLPLTRPALAAVVILNGVWMWNDFFLGFILITKPGSMTLPVGIMAFRGTYSTEWGLIFASVTISVLPVVAAYLLLSRQFIAGLTAGRVKGYPRGWGQSRQGRTRRSDPKKKHN